jgi:hypothetical protein
MPLRKRGGDAAPVAVVAAGAPIKVADFAEAQETALTRQPWQFRSYGYYDDVGEIHFAARYIGNAMTRIRLVAAEQSDEDDDAPKPTDNQAVKDAVAKLKSPRGGQGGLLRQLGINVFLVGECFLIGIDHSGGKQEWAAASINELQIRPGDGAYRVTSPTVQPVRLPKSTLVIRVWNEHPRYSALADASIRSCLDDCEKLLLLTRADKAAARSRFAGAGLLFIPNELLPVSQGPDAQSEDVMDPGKNPVYKNLIESMITPIRDEGHPSGVVPIVIFGPGEEGKNIRYITFDRPISAQSSKQREEAITRIATAIDLPSEILTGKVDLNHWTAWQVHEESFQAHLQPFVELICDALTHAYLIPALRAAKVPDAEKYVIWYDASQLIVRPDKGQTAGQLFSDNVISSAAWRRETGFSEEDAMDEEEYSKRVGIILQDVQLALTGEPTPPEAPKPGPGKGGDSPTIEDKLRGPEKPKGPQPKVEAETKRPGSVTASAEQKRQIGRKLAELDIALMNRLSAAASEVMARELERAGARVRSKAAGELNYRDLLRDIPNNQVPSVLGPSVVASLDLSDHDLLKGAFAAFGAKVSEMLASAQTQRNRLLHRYLGLGAGDIDSIYGETDRSHRGGAVAAFIAALGALALRKLYDPNPEATIPGKGEFDGQLVPNQMVRRAVSLAGGSSAPERPSDLTKPQAYGGVGTGETAIGILENAGQHVDHYEWVYGPSIRKVAFQSHEELDGLEFANDDDPRLVIQPKDAWLGVDHYHPGDHFGCLCMAAPIISSKG